MHTTGTTARKTRPPALLILLAAALVYAAPARADWDEDLDGDLSGDPAA